jgi:hypothetical protein
MAGKPLSVGTLGPVAFRERKLAKGMQADIGKKCGTFSMGCGGISALLLECNSPVNHFIPTKNSGSQHPMESRAGAAKI